MNRVVLLLLMLFCGALFPARARDVADPVQVKFNAVAAEIDKEERAAALDEIEARQARSSLADVQRMAGQASSFETVMSHAKHTATTAKTPELRAVWAEAVAALEVEEKAEVEAQKKTFEAHEALFRRAAEACAHAQKPDDLAGVLQELQEASAEPSKSRSRSDFPGLSQQHSQLVQAMNFVASWKQMLADAANGDDPGAISRLKAMMRSTSGRIAQQIPATALEARLKELQDKRAARLDEILKTAARDLPAAKSARDAQTIADRLRSARDEEPSRRYDDALARAADAAQVWSDTLRAEEEGEWAAAYEKLAELTARRARNESRLLPAEAIEAKRKTLWTHLSEKSEAALADFPAALQKAQSSSAAREVASKYQTLGDDLNAQQSYALRREPEFALLATRLTRAAGTAMAWAGLLAAEEQQRWIEGLKAVTDLTRPAATETDAGLIPKDLLAQKEKHFLQGVLAGGAVRMEEADPDWHRAFSRSISALSKPEETTALIEAARRLVPALDENAAEDLRNLQRDLASLAAEWNGAPAASETPSHPWSAETQAIRNRLRRERIAREMALPEISAPPLADQPLEAALNALADDCAHRGDWRRALDCLTASQQILGATRGQHGARSDTLGREIQAVSDFLAGGNFERAEQYAEAVRAYQNVLRQPGGHVPIREATERLRALKKEHGELFPAAPEATPH